MCSVVFRVLSSSRSGLFCILSSHTVWSVPLAKYANVNVMCGYVFWQGGQLCLAGEMKVEVQPVPESGCTQCRHEDKVLFMRQQSMKIEQ